MEILGGEREFVGLFCWSLLFTETFTSSPVGGWGNWVFGDDVIGHGEWDVVG